MADKKDYIFTGWDFTPVYDYIDKSKALYKDVPEVYQYTSVEALFNGIVRPQEDGFVDLCLLSTNCQYLNDANEIQYGKDVVNTVVFGHLKESGEEFRKLINLDHIYLSSFSTEVNHLPMWSMYGREGKGIALGFDINLLQSEKRQLFRCIYDQIKFRYEIQQAVMSSRKKENTIGNDPVEFSRYISILQELIKHHCYEYEHEYRLIVDTDEKPKYRNSGGILVPYVENHFPANALRTVIVGPRNDDEMVVKSIKGWLDSIGMGNVNVVPSGLPFR